MSTKADWFVAEVDHFDPLGGEPDPFSVPVEEIGKPIDLRDRAARLQIRLDELMQVEAGLFNRGVECPIRSRGDTTCLACPVHKASDQEHPLYLLCRAGRESDTVLTQLAVERHGFRP